MSKIVKCLLISLWFGLACLGAQAGANPQVIRFAMTPAFLHDQHALLAEWRGYLEVRLKRPVEFVQRDRYRETMDLLNQQKVEFAWLCDYPYVMLKDEVRLLAVALNEGQPTYRSYLIVPARDTRTTSVGDLQGAVFAYADPYSNTGYLVPRFEIKRRGANPATFFKRTFFTWSHRKAIDAVAAGLSQGAAVDSYVWDVLNKVRPDITAKTRIAWRSPDYGFPPMVAQKNVSEVDFLRMQSVLMDMKNNEQGRALLTRLKLDGFIEGSPKLYDSVSEMMRLVDNR
ncbi:MAG: PhnD/SsuA/transferrin family substrate-binding protein [Gammaproteobacteria bacterium]|uniref:substrate-binding domain-containing protein n=1 Tax=Rhodoferax sp. TaxID=50421 RepID=UPI00180D7DE7|nr:PhnD/SsuA/transferrin family substrate-binding protein [Rhodoferax sp.]MBU3900639.1 PhnD/SsuA/transferrin family substrate-binding protein [Gammaproteobacteria bacterium]MBA3057729.1 PhnD/SsuA/transferrin family substrate-binding protein [Rhodoferax sp.]MBU3996653.1 PhnD/SsuA/transferrin family substrate-binding protein [Gammaproteobacteria bacterium]MBU4080984.1 PhnD/SsuA/transferrin family substrate-binding protein [Gammaproteobacteria bacterium]MBU4112043.1 PhnD/SsuA/transferrin family s